jgi:hypothetical protein
MIQRTIRRRTGLLLLALPVLVSLACNTRLGRPPGATPVVGAPTGAATLALGQSTVAATPAGAPTVEGTPAPAAGTAVVPLVLGPGAFTLPDATAGLADLASYQATLTLTFTGTRDGTSQKWSKTYVMLSTKEPAARQVTIEKKGDLADLTPGFVAEVEGVAYELAGDNSCTAAVFKPQDSPAQALEPAGLLTGVIGADEAGAETVNDVPAKHYTFDERALALLNIAKSTGELWVATDGGYLVKYVLTTTGGADYFGSGTDGTLSWDYELTQVNQPVPFDLPADCPPGLVQAPRLPDAANVQDTPGVLAYDSASSLADAVTFYQTQLTGLGWQLTGDPIAVADIPKDQTTVVLDFTQASQTLTVILTLSETGTQVSILQASAPK